MQLVNYILKYLIYIDMMLTKCFKTIFFNCVASKFCNLLTKIDEFSLKI
jgi:hypothetical protein